MGQFSYGSLLAKAKGILTSIGIVIIGGIMLFASLGKIEMPPDNVIVFIDKIEKTYFSPPLMIEDDRDFLVMTALGYAKAVEMKPATSDISEFAKNLPSEKVAWVDFKRGVFYLSPQKDYNFLHFEKIGEVRQKGYSPDEKHRDWSGFVDDYGFLDIILELLGLKDSRWTEDGGWRW